jgi:ABC-type branched-subunit amino acid transport system substrate-binding protein
MKKFFTSAVALLMIIILNVSCYSAPNGCNDPLGCQEVSAGNPLVIGALLTIYGQQGTAGLKVLDELRTIKEITGEILDHPIDLDWQGTDCTENSARLAATLLARNQRLIAVIGPTCGSDSSTALPILEDAGLQLIPPTPSPTVAFLRLLSAIQDVAILRKDGTLLIPRTDLQNLISIQP